jgi:glycosyltransferase involved in cell wall biosynthesis
MLKQFEKNRSSETASVPQVFKQLPVVSVIMITYNHAPYVGQAIEGVLAQTLKEPFELVIGEDCSTDGTREIVESFRGQHPDIIRVVSGHENIGMNENLRRVVLAARGTYVAFCEGDDVWHCRDKLARQLEVIRSHPDIGMVYSDYDRAIRFFGRWRVMPGAIRGAGVMAAEGHAFEDLLDRIQVHLSTLMCRSALVAKYFQSDLYDPSLRLADVPLLLFCAAHARVAYLPISTSIYRATPNSATNRSRQNLLRIIQDHVAVVRRFERHFGSEPARRHARAARLDAMIATAAYSAGHLKAYAAVAGKDVRARLRAALMGAPLLHNIYMAWVAATQKFNFWTVSQDAPRLN